MSLRNNILSNYLSQFYVTLIGIVMIPVYIRFMGVEAYGLVGFFSMLQAWFMLLDMGLTPTMVREVARFRGGATDVLMLRRLLRALEGIFIGVGVFGAVAMIVGADSIASRWLKVERLPPEDVVHAIMLMAIIVALRWMCGLYRGVINGFEQLVWLSWFNTATATARFVLVIPVLLMVDTSATTFFAYQVVIAVVEVIWLTFKVYALLPDVLERCIPWRWEPLHGVLKFSLSIAFTGAVWVLVTQTDKLILSTMLALSDYAYFTLAVLVASGILMLSAPISGALLPRMTKMNAEGDQNGLLRLYRQSTQLVGIIIVPPTLVLAFFPEQILWAWTGDIVIAQRSALVLTLYALGNGLLALAAFPYYLQFAKGDLKLHLIGNALFVAMFIPILLWAVNRHGMEGAGYAWIAANLIPFLFWLPLVHRRFVRGLHLQWIMRDVMPIVALPLVIAFCLQRWVILPQARSMIAVVLFAISSGLVVAAVASSSWARGKIISKWHSQIAQG